MSDLIEALQIFLKYHNPHNPIHCEHDEMFVCVDPDRVIEKDKEKLEKLSFTPNNFGGFSSYRFGSC